MQIVNKTQARIAAVWEIYQELKIKLQPKVVVELKGQ
jgi:hypothetical protein